MAQYSDMLQKIRELEKQYGISPICDLYIDSLEDRRAYLEWLLNDGNPGYSTIPII